MYGCTMPRKRKTPNEVAESNKAVLFPKRTRISNSRSSKSDDVFNSKKCTAWFNEYSSLEESGNIIGPEGIEKFCGDIGVEPENVIMLVIAWKMNAKQMGYFTYDEWMKGLSELQCDSLQKLKNQMDYLKSLSKEHQVFKHIYRFAFDFARDKQQRSLDIETAKSMLELLLGDGWKLFGEFRVFLEKSKYKIINKDQWFNILEFSRSIHSDLSNYDIDGAWPVMLDEFVEWLKMGTEEELEDCH